MADETKKPEEKNPYDDFISELVKIDRHIKGIIDSVKGLGKKGNNVTKDIEKKVKE